MKFQTTFTIPGLSHKSTFQTSTEINGKLYFFKFWMVEPLETLQTVLNVKIKYIADKNIWWDYCHSIYSFINFKVLVGLPKSFQCPFTYENALHLVYWACYWSQFNWVKQADNTSVHWVVTCFAFCQWTNDLPVQASFMSIFILTQHNYSFKVKYSLAKVDSFELYWYWSIFFLIATKSVSQSLK